MFDIHAVKLLDFAVFDILGTLGIALFIQFVLFRYVCIQSRANKWHSIIWIFLFLIIISIPIHVVVGVNSKLVRILKGDFSSGTSLVSNTSRMDT